MPERETTAMDWLTHQLTQHKIPVGQWGKQFFGFLTSYFDWFFDGLSKGITTALDAMIAALLYPPPLVVVAGLVVFAFILQRSWQIALGVLLGLLYIINQGLWKETIETLALVLGATTVSMAIGVPLGIAAAHRAWLFQLSAAGPRPDADAADLRLSDPGAHPVRPRPGAGPDRHGDLRPRRRRSGSPISASPRCRSS